MSKIKFIVLVFVAVFLVIACKEDDDETLDPVIIEWDKTPYVLDHGALPKPELPADNPLTEQGVQLGRMLFYETELSKDNSQACASCHRQPDGFSDSTRFSLGVDLLPGKRQAMPVFNLAWHSNEFFWDGRAQTLREQSLMPIQDPLEMDETLENVIAKLSDRQIYKDQFTRAFGSAEMTAEKVSLALEQFMLSIVSSNSKYDKYLAGETDLSASEERGRLLFETEYNPFFPDESGADCMHCHGGANFENDQYMNNGLDTDATMLDFGREDVTQNPSDRGKFKVPSLRNVALTAPYMHDGRFKTLEEVIDHYNTGIQESATADPTVLNTKEKGLLLSDQDKVDLIHFLETLTDDVFVNTAAYGTPF